ncbi:MAG TPA: lectin-like protein [Phycisphaerales bacterium]|nr:lectin-like protein [Phycisphaerales bacterium]
MSFCLFRTRGLVDTIGTTQPSNGLRRSHVALIVGGLMLASAGAPSAAFGQADIFEFNGHQYRLYADSSARTWADAAAFAATLSVGGQSGYLARIDSAAENTRIVQSILANQGVLTRTAADGGGGRYVWIGANDRAAEGAWRWADGTQFWSGGPGGSAVGGLYNNWGTNQSGRTEPDNFLFQAAGQDAAGISVNGWPLGTAGQWNDIGETNVMPFIVEFNVVPAPGALAPLAVLLVCGRRRRERKS